MASPLSSDFCNMQEIVPSLVFVAAFAAVVPFAVWRWSSQHSRTLILVNPTFFVALRLATWILRTFIAGGHGSAILELTEKTLTALGPALLVEPIISLTTHLLDSPILVDASSLPLATSLYRRKQIVCRLMGLGLLSAVALAMYSTILALEATTNPSATTTIEMLHKLIAFIILFIVLGCINVNAAISVHHEDGLTPAPFLIACAGALFLSSIYGVAAASHMAWAQSQIAFYALHGMPELFAAAMFFAVDLNELFGLVATPAEHVTHEYQLIAEMAYPDLKFYV